MYWLLDAIHWHMCYDDASTVNAWVALHNKLTIDKKKSRNKKFYKISQACAKKVQLELIISDLIKKEQKQAFIKDF